MFFTNFTYKLPAASSLSLRVHRDPKHTMKHLKPQGMVFEWVKSVNYFLSYSRGHTCTQQSNHQGL